MLDRELSVGAGFTRCDFQMAAERVRHGVGSGKGADRRAANAQYGFTHRPAIEHRMKINNTAHLGERYAQSAAYLRSHRLGKPSIQALRGVQRRQKRAAALASRRGEER